MTWDLSYIQLELHDIKSLDSLQALMKEFNWRDCVINDHDDDDDGGGGGDKDENFILCGRSPRSFDALRV